MTTIEELETIKDNIKEKMGYNLIPADSDIQTEINKIRQQLTGFSYKTSFEDNTDYYFSENIGQGLIYMYKGVKGNVVDDYTEIITTEMIMLINNFGVKTSIGEEQPSIYFLNNTLIDIPNIYVMAYQKSDNEFDENSPFCISTNVQLPSEEVVITVKDKDTEEIIDRNIRIYIRLLNSNVDANNNNMDFISSSGSFSIFFEEGSIELGFTIDGYNKLYDSEKNELEEPPIITASNTTQNITFYCEKDQQTISH